jgi:hypothetical protein
MKFVYGQCVRCGILFDKHCFAAAAFEAKYRDHDIAHTCLECDTGEPPEPWVLATCGEKRNGSYSWVVDTAKVRDMTIALMVAGKLEGV